MRVDAHQHFWEYSTHPEHFAWMSPEQSLLRRDYLPPDLIGDLRAIGFDGCVAVQARELVEETAFLLEVARTNPFVLGVVGWFDLCDPNVSRDLDRYADEPSLKGLRMLVHDRLDVDFANSEPHRRGVALLERRGLTYDLLLRPQHLASAVGLVDALPNQPFVVDHIAKPDMRLDGMEPWLHGMVELSQRPNVSCKLSSLVTQLDRPSWSPQDLWPYLDALYRHFGADRLMIGSDWPVCLTRADYGKTMGVVIDWSRQLSESERDAVLGGTASRFYDLRTS